MIWLKGLEFVIECVGYIKNRNGAVGCCDKYQRWLNFFPLPSFNIIVLYHVIRTGADYELLLIHHHHFEPSGH